MHARPAGSRIALHLPLVLIIVMGMLLVWYSTVWGAGLISDSFQYTAGAKNLALGNGFTLPYGDGELEPMTKYPPMFSTLLAVFVLAGGSALQGARALNVILMGANIFLVFHSTKRLSQSHWFSLLAALLFAISFVMVELHSWALSDALYICLSLVSILADRTFDMLMGSAVPPRRRFIQTHARDVRNLDI